MALTDAELDRLIYLAYVLRGSDAQTVRLRVMARNTIYANLHAGEFLRILPERLKMLDARERENKRRDV